MLVEAVGIEIIKSQNPKELCGIGCIRMSFIALGRNCGRGNAWSSPLNCYEDAGRANTYATVGFANTYYLAIRDLPRILSEHVIEHEHFACGTGRSGRFLQKLGFKVIGIECPKTCCGSHTPLILASHWRDSTLADATIIIYEGRSLGDLRLGTCRVATLRTLRLRCE